MLHHFFAKDASLPSPLCNRQESNSGVGFSPLSSSSGGFCFRISLSCPHTSFWWFFCINISAFNRSLRSRYKKKRLNSNSTPSGTPTPAPIAVEVFDTLLESEVVVVLICGLTGVADVFAVEFEGADTVFDNELVGNVIG